MHRTRMGNRKSDQNENEWANDDDCLCISITFLARGARARECAAFAVFFSMPRLNHMDTLIDTDIHTYREREEAKHYDVEHENPIRKKLRDENRKKQRLANWECVCVCAEQFRVCAKRVLASS